jgi:hypothetical protein
MWEATGAGVESKWPFSDHDATSSVLMLELLANVTPGYQGDFQDANGNNEIQRLNMVFGFNNWKSGKSVVDESLFMNLTEGNNYTYSIFGPVASPDH